MEPLERISHEKKASELLQIMTNDNGNGDDDDDNGAYLNFKSYSFYHRFRYVWV